MADSTITTIKQVVSSALSAFSKVAKAYFVHDDSYTHTDNNYTTADKNKLGGIAQGADVSPITSVKRNGTAVAISDKAVDISVPTKTSELTNDDSTVKDADYAELKAKVGRTADGAEVNQNAFSAVKVGATSIDADSKTDTLEIAAGSNVTLTPDADGDKLTIAATDTTYSAVGTTGDPGLMTAADKVRLNGIADGAQANVIEGVTVGGTDATVTSKKVALGSAAGASTASSVGNDANLPTGAAVQSYVTGLGYQTSAQVESAITGKGYQTASDVSGAISTALGSVYQVKGSVANFAALPKSGQAKGDVYNVVAANGDTPAGTNYVWTGEAWDALGGTIDLSGYIQTSDLEGFTEAEVKTIFDAA